MKTLLFAACVAAVMFVIVSFYPAEVIEVHNPEPVPVEPVEEVDEIEKAKQELARINAELDAKEAELLEQRNALDAELERVREARVSFQ